MNGLAIRQIDGRNGQKFSGSFVHTNMDEYWIWSINRNNGFDINKAIMALVHEASAIPKWAPAPPIKRERQIRFTLDKLIPRD